MTKQEILKTYKEELDYRYEGIKIREEEIETEKDRIEEVKKIIIHLEGEI